MPDYDHDIDPGDGCCRRCSHDAASTPSRCPVPPIETNATPKNTLATPAPLADRLNRTLTIYRDDSTVQVVYERVKSVFWTAGNTVLVVSQYTDEQTGAHRYIHWPRERFCWFKDEPQP